ncbi:MAG TPA: hypothetical protein VF503_12770 [Sphingobium sp.]|uniref:hypothetical protein n=1 Tax=Sphingobium sp. TaxID=1912891 RepID=UPI002ED1FC04
MSETPDALAGQSEATLDRLLNRLPPPQIPGSLAARIVRDVTRLPQLPVEETAEPDFAGDRTTVIAFTPAKPRRRWIAWTGGGVATALAAGLATLLLLPETAQRQSPPDMPSSVPAPVTIAEAAPASAPAATAGDARRPKDVRPAPTAPQPSSTVPASRTASVPSPQSPIEVAETGAEAAPRAAQTDNITADDDAELVDGGNLALPDVTGQAPPTPGWGYAPGTGSPKTAPGVRRSEDGLGDTGGGMGDRRRRGPLLPERGF